MPLKNHQSILDVRILGAIGVVEFNEDLDMKKTQEEYYVTTSTSL
jgi:adenosylmethionine-8-amino-7-oxononanoate aminotransferase